MNSLLPHASLLKRFSTFELSYETVSHKKVSVADSIAVAVPLGRKYFLWFTHREGGCDDVCYVLGLDKDKQICSVEEKTDGVIPKDFSLGTAVYATMCEIDASTSIFVAEDIYQFRGIPLHNLCFGDRIGFLRDFVKAYKQVALPLMWFVKAGSEMSHNVSAGDAIPAYTVHHVQYREVRRVAPYINVAIPKKGTTTTITSSAEVAQKLYATAISNPIPNFDYGKPAFRYPAVFNIMADAQLDLYHLYAYGGQGATVYCGLPGIQSYKNSVFMNRIFRRIRENANLDLAEESEDDEDFENTDANKFVDLDRVVAIECIFSVRHKKWIPTRLAAKEDRIIHIEKLVLAKSDNRQFHRGGGGHNQHSTPVNRPVFHKRHGSASYHK